MVVSLLQMPGKWDYQIENVFYYPVGQRGVFRPDYLHGILYMANY